MTNTYQKTLELVSRLSLQERLQLKSDLDDMTTGDIRPAGWIDQLLEAGEQSITSDGVKTVDEALWTKLKAPYAN